MKMVGLLITFLAVPALARQLTPAQQLTSDGLVLVLADDRSRSVESWPATERSDIQTMVGLAASSCGTLAICAVNDSSFRPLLRQEFCLRLIPTESLGLSDGAAVRRINDSIRAAVDAVATAFLDKAMDYLKGPRKAARTDLAGATSRIELLLGEPIFACSRKVVIVNSDAVPTTAGTVSLPADALVIVVGARRETALRTFGEQTVCCESLDGALRYVRRLLTASAGLVPVSYLRTP